MAVIQDKSRVYIFPADISVAGTSLVGISFVDSSQADMYSLPVADIAVSAVWVAWAALASWVSSPLWAWEVACLT